MTSTLQGPEEVPQLAGAVQPPGEELLGSSQFTMMSTQQEPEPSFQSAVAPLQTRGDVFFGLPGVTVRGVPRLHFDHFGVMLDHASSGDRFSSDGGGGFDTALGTFAELTAVTGGYELVDRYHTTYSFDSEGYAVSMVDALGRLTTFDYVTLSYGRQISSIAGPFVTTTFSYVDERLTSVSDTLTNSVVLAYTAGRLTTATQNDPDGPGPLPAPVTSYYYDTNGRVSSVVGPGGLVTEYSYDATGHFKGIIAPGGKATELISASLTALETGEFTETELRSPNCVHRIAFYAGGRHEGTWFCF